MSYFQSVKKLTALNVSDEMLISLVFEMSRFSDNKYTREVQRLQKEHSIVFDSPTRKQLRRIFYYGKLCSLSNDYGIIPCDYSRENIETVFEDCFRRLNTYDPDKIICSMKKRIDDLKNNVDSDSNMAVWLKQFNTRRHSKMYSFVAIRVDQALFKKAKYNEDILTDFIYHTYDSLENYRHLSIIVQGELFNKNKECITWKMLYKAGIYAENFIQYEENFNPFNKEKQINSLTDFLNARDISQARKISEDFYSGIQTGYKYEDCYISNDQSTKILIFKKIELDQTHIPCPSCNTIIQSGNSYPEMFLRSWECKNPACPDRSKSGRGKRFDEYGVYRYFKLVEGDKNNTISDDLYQSFRRDVFDHSKDWREFLLKEYTFSKEKVFMYNCSIDHKYKRVVLDCNINELSIHANAVKCYEDLPIVKFFNSVVSNKNFKTGKKKLKENLEIVNDDSSVFLQTLLPGQIGTAITSPPYYNAREYSQWPNLIMYFVDMLINCKVIYNVMAPDSYYLYNIGDIVSEDNIYVVSNMSKHRVQLGFLSSMIFEIAGFNLTGNIIWDKGEVQSKRNSTVNLASGYVKCINCYEHVLVFRKGSFERLSNTVEQITPVIKINNKGENTYKHTAPYPIELVDLVRPYVNKDLYVLDPFLGSGTTLKWCKKNNFKGIGTELNSTYFELCKDYIYETNHQLSIFDELQ